MSRRAGKMGVNQVKTGLVSVSFRKLSVDEIIGLAMKAGLGSIEWGGDVHVPPENVDHARLVGEKTRAAGLEVACYGSYYRLTDVESDMAEKVVAAAKALGAPLIRVWAGVSGSREASEEKRNEICRNMRSIAGLAKDENLEVAFEYHGGTLTDTADSAKRLLESVDRSNAGTLWQPPVGMSAEDCAESIRTVGDWIRNIHVFSWNGTERLPLAEGEVKWRACLAEIGRLPGEHRLMMEFVRGDDSAQLLEDAACLARWARGEWNA